MWGFQSQALNHFQFKTEEEERCVFISSWKLQLAISLEDGKWEGFCWKINDDRQTRKDHNVSGSCLSWLNLARALPRQKQMKTERQR